jgi:hypothetical protein
LSPPHVHSIDATDTSFMFCLSPLAASPHSWCATGVVGAGGALGSGVGVGGMLGIGDGIHVVGSGVGDSVVGRPRGWPTPSWMASSEDEAALASWPEARDAAVATITVAATAESAAAIGRQRPPLLRASPSTAPAAATAGSNSSTEPCTCADAHASWPSSPCCSDRSIGTRHTLYETCDALSVRLRIDGKCRFIRFGHCHIFLCDDAT